MKKILLSITTLLLAGCLVTETRKVETRGRKPGDLWWRDPQYASDASEAAVVSSGCCPTTAQPLSDEEYFEENSFRWPGDWQERHPPTPQTPSTPQEAPAQPEGCSEAY